jgi:hypothetical protein
LFGLKVGVFLDCQEEIASYHTYGFQASLEPEKGVQPHARRGRTTSEGYPINGSTRQLLCALARGRRTMFSFPTSATQSFIRGVSTVIRPGIVVWLAYVQDK